MRRKKDHSETRGISGRRIQALIWAMIVCAFIYWWSASAGDNSGIVLYFERPSDVLSYLNTNWRDVLRRSFLCFITTLVSVVFAGAIALALLAAGMLSNQWLTRIERLAATLQTVPMLIIVVVALLAEQAAFTALNISPPIEVYCLPPVIASLLFAPLVNGISSINNASLTTKALMRIWDVERFSRVWRVYLPIVLPDVLTGLRSSAAWALGAMLVVQSMLDGVEGNTDTLGHSLIRPFYPKPVAGETLTVVLVSIALGFGVYYITKAIQTFVETRIYGRTRAAHREYPLQSD